MKYIFRLSFFIFLPIFLLCFSFSRFPPKHDIIIAILWSQKVDPSLRTSSRTKEWWRKQLAVTTGNSPESDPPETGRNLFSCQIWGSKRKIKNLNRAAGMLVCHNIQTLCIQPMHSPNSQHYSHFLGPDWKKQSSPLCILHSLYYTCLQENWNTAQGCYPPAPTLLIWKASRVESIMSSKASAVERSQSRQRELGGDVSTRGATERKQKPDSWVTRPEVKLSFRCLFDLILQCLRKVYADTQSLKTELLNMSSSILSRLTAEWCEASLCRHIMHWNLTDPHIIVIQLGHRLP